MPVERATIALLHDDGEPPAEVVSRIESADAVAEVAVTTPDEEYAEIEDPDCVIAATDGRTDPIERATDRFAETPVLALAPANDGLHPQNAFEAGATDFLRRDEEGRAVLSRRVETLVEYRRSERGFGAGMTDVTGVACLLSPAGTVERANDAAKLAASEPVEGTRFVELPWCERAACDRVDLENAIRRAGAGEKRVVETSVARGGGLDVAMAFRPITDRDESAKIIAEVRGITDGGIAWQPRPLLETIVENVPMVLFAFDAEGTFLLSEGEGLATIGLEPGEVVGESVFDVYADHESIRRNCRRALDGERVGDVVEVGETAFETWYVPVTEHGEVTEVIGAGLDVTDLQERKRELARQNERLEEFASIVSHDLRNPLSVARGGVEFLTDECDSSHVQRVEEALDRMSAIVDDVLTLARTGETVEDYDRVSLREVVEAAWRTVETADATLTVADDGTLLAEAGRLQRLFENLLANAVEHGGPRVSVRVGALEDGFYVADDGPGIPPADREAVFESRYSTAERGTGFGLAIVREIADAHGWEASVTESVSGGARFEITGVKSVRSEGRAESQKRIE